jgi:hypothetical protein
LSHGDFFNNTQIMQWCARISAGSKIYLFTRTHATCILRRQMHTCRMRAVAILSVGAPVSDFTHEAVAPCHLSACSSWVPAPLPCRYKDYARTLLGRVNSINGRTYSADPTIFAWDLLNEARCQGCPPYAIAVRACLSERCCLVRQPPMLLHTMGILAHPSLSCLLRNRMTGAQFLAGDYIECVCSRFCATAMPASKLLYIPLSRGASAAGLCPA